MAKKKNKHSPSQTHFNEQLILFRYFLHLFGHDTLKSLAGRLNDSEYEGYDQNQNTFFYKYLDQMCIMRKDKVKINRDKLRQYDENICHYVKKIGEKRGGIVLKYFQYLALLFTEIYLDRYFSEQDAFIVDLNEYIDSISADTMGAINFDYYTPTSMNKLAFMCATGSGKTLIMHINILQFLYYLKRAQRLNSHLAINKIIVLAPNEGMSLQHLEELKISSISAAIFQKDIGLLTQREDVIIIDMNKLKDEGKIKTVSVDSFEQNNLVLVDEAHRGIAGDVWKEYRDKLSMNGGFAFEYSATFKQALKSLKAIKDRSLLDEYCKSIIMDYSYKFFYEDGYGKEYRIYNLRESINDEQRHLYLTGCLLTFYQQLKLFKSYPKEFAPYEIQKPLLVFVGNRVTATTTAAELTDVEEVLNFIDKFVRNKSTTIERIRQVLEEDTGLMDNRGKELFSQDFTTLAILWGSTPKPEDIYTDILRTVFNSETISEEPRLYMENLRQVQGEIALKIGEVGEYFGVISIGETTKLIKYCDEKGIVVKTEEFISDSLFQNINSSMSSINVLVGSRKFTEGWNSWRVSTMGLINFAKGEGSQAIQLFGRGVRLRGYHGCLKRSSKLDERSVSIPRYIHQLETLTIFGIRAQYMEDFKQYLELEEMPSNENIREFTLPVISRYDEVKDKKLQVIKLPDRVSFKKQAKRLIMDVPDLGFMRYLEKHRIIIDCRSKIQTIDSSISLQLDSATEERTLEKNYLPFLDYTRIYEELETYKVAKYYHNIIIDKSKIQPILETEGWYSLIIPQAHIKIDSMKKLEAAVDYCVIVLKSYMDKFYKYQREKWEAPLIEYQALTENDNNFVQKYEILYKDVNEQDTGATVMEQFLKEISNLLDKEKHLPGYQKGLFKNTLVAFDFNSHLYAPLLCLKTDIQKIQIVPVSMNEDEKRFVDRLKAYTDTNMDFLENKSLYLLRNKSRTGMGFFEAGNFYPDYILWIDTQEIQYISFIDPKGLMKLEIDDPKIEFYSNIKILESRLQSTSKDKKVVLNSFIMSGTPPAALKMKWNMGKSKLEAKHILCLDHDDCIDVMISKILQ